MAPETTTESAIRDRMARLIADIVPSTNSEIRFSEHRYEEDFRLYAARNPTLIRRFAVTAETVVDPPEVSNCEREAEICDFEILVQYARTHRFGVPLEPRLYAVMAEDRKLIQNAVGLRGYANFEAPHPSASWLKDRASAAREPASDAVVLLVIRQGFTFYRAV
jgi:hypothetical protein